jgi:hypothetical protein
VEAVSASIFFTQNFYLDIYSMKPNKTFKMNKSTKRLLAGLSGESHTRFKKDMIESQLYSTVVIREKKKSNKQKEAVADEE